MGIIQRVSEGINPTTQGLNNQPAFLPSPDFFVFPNSRIKICPHFAYAPLFYSMEVKIDQGGIFQSLLVNQLIKIMWHFGFKSHLLTAGGVFEGNRFGMKR